MITRVSVTTSDLSSAEDLVRAGAGFLLLIKRINELIFTVDNRGFSFQIDLSLFLVFNAS